MKHDISHHRCNASCGNMKHLVNDALTVVLMRVSATNKAVAVFVTIGGGEVHMSRGAEVLVKRVMENT